MRKFALLFGLLLAVPLLAQNLSTSGNLTLQATGCTVGASSGAGQVLYRIPSNAASIAIGLSGTWSGTIQFVGSIDGVNWSSLQASPLAGGAAVASATANGNWSVTAGGYPYVCAYASTYSSGTIVVAMSVTTGAIAAAATVSTIPPMPTGAQAFYLMNAGSGTTVADLSGSGNGCTFGTTIHAPTWNGTNGLIFLGSNNQFLQCPAAAFNGAQTLEIWFNNKTLASVGSTGAVISTDANNGTGLQLLTSSSGWGSAFSMFTTGNANFLTSGDRTIGPSQLALTFGSGTPLAYIDGHPSLSYEWQISGQMTSYSATTNAYIGSYKNGVGPSFSGNIYAVITRSTVANAAQIQADDAYVRSVMLAPYGLAEQDYTQWSAPLWLSQGDSIMQGGGVGDVFNNTLSYYASQQLGNPFDTYNFSIGGKSCSDFAPDYAAHEHPMIAAHFNAIKIISLECGTNDVIANSTAVTIEGYITTYCTAVHADFGKCVYFDILPRQPFTSGQQTIATAVNTWAINSWLTSAGLIDNLVDWAGSPIMGSQTVAAGTFNATYYLDGTHPTALGNQILGQITSLGVCLAGMPGQPCWATIPLIYQASAAAATTQTLPLLQLGPGQQICGAKLTVTTAYAASGLASLGLTIGDSTGSATQYLTSTSLTTTSKALNLNPNFANVNGIVQANFTASGANLSTLSAGAANVDLCVVSAI